MARREPQKRSKAPTFEATERLVKRERGSLLYYEVARQGKWLAIRTGHVGLDGSTRMREYPTDAAASTAMERILADRREEGWHEPESGRR